MSIPSYDQLIEPVLRYLAEQKSPVAVSQVSAEVARRAKLSDAELTQLLPNNTQPVFRNRIGWAHDRLKRAGLSGCPRRGMWLLTELGREFAARHKSLSAEDIEKVAYVAPDAPRLSPQKDKSGGAQVPSAPSSPTERIDGALEELRESVARDLLELIYQSSPAFFERLVLDVLHAMGYGGSRKDLQHVGGSGDEGIDGVISLDKLGLDRVYVQAKKWKGDVRSPQIQGFMGALKLKDADKGVLITPGAFTSDAREIAKKAQGKLVLIDGDRLTELMIEHGVGVAHQTLNIPQVDRDFFEND